MYAYIIAGVVAFIGATFLVSSTGYASERLAVLPAETVNVDEADAQRVSALLKERLQQTRAFVVIHTPQAKAHAETCAHTPACLQATAAEVNATKLLQLRIGALGGTFVVRLTLFHGPTGARAGSWQEVLTRLDDQTATAALDRMIAGFTPRPATTSTPWYRRWWVWTAAGVVVAAATTAIILSTTGSGDAPDHIIRPP